MEQSRHIGTPHGAVGVLHPENSSDIPQVAISKYILIDIGIFILWEIMGNNGNL